MLSGAGTNLKVGAPVRSESGGAPNRRLFGSKSTISRFSQRFRDGQCSLVSFLFAVLLLTVPLPCPTICKNWGHVPPFPCPHGIGATDYADS